MSPNILSSLIIVSIAKHTQSSSFFFDITQKNIACLQIFRDHVKYIFFALPQYHFHKRMIYLEKTEHELASI